MTKSKLEMTKAQLETQDNWVIARDHIDTYPLGTKYRCLSGGYWVRVENGYKWCTGSTFSRIGGDWTGEICLPKNKGLMEENTKKVRVIYKVLSNNFKKGESEWDEAMLSEGLMGEVVAEFEFPEGWQENGMCHHSIQTQADKFLKELFRVEYTTEELDGKKE
jgi:hypothetical protein